MSIDVNSPSIFLDKTLKNSGYHQLSSFEVSGRLIRKYLLEDSKDDTLTKAGDAIKQLLKNPNFCRTFPIEPSETLREEIRSKNYLTINGRAVCFSKKPNAPGTAQREYKNRFFSETLFKKPVKCVRGHYLEKRSAKFWIQGMKNDICPVGLDHPIGSLVVDDDLQRDIAEFKQTQKEIEQHEEMLTHRINKYENANIRQNLELVFQQTQIDRLSNRKLHVTDLIAASAKVALKVGTKEIAVIFGKQLGKIVVKLIPIVSLGIGLVLGIKRFISREYAKGCVEIVSGCVACIPWGGTVASVVIDLGLAGHDIYEATVKELPAPIDKAFDYETACQILGVDLTNNLSPTQEEVNAAFLKQMAAFISDKVQGLDDPGEIIAGQEDKLAQLLSKAKNSVYEKNGWS